MPAELLDKIYGYLFGFESTRFEFRPRGPTPPMLKKEHAPIKHPVNILRGTIVGYLAGNPMYYRIQPDKVNGVQPPDV